MQHFMRSDRSFFGTAVVELLLVIIYPFDDRRELRSAVHFSYAVWQLRILELK